MRSWPRDPNSCARCRSSRRPARGACGSWRSPASTCSRAAARISGTPPRSARSRSRRSRTRAGRTAASSLLSPNSEEPGRPARLAAETAAVQGEHRMPYARPDALVSTEWLAAHLNDPRVRVLDSSFKQPGITPTAREDYERGHIPGAVFFDIDDVATPGTSLPHMVPSAELFARKMEERGIGDGDRIVVYDAAGLSSAGRAWWMLRLFGHTNVALLDGGLPKWKEEGRPLDTAASKPPRGRFTARLDASLLRDKAALIANLDSRREQVVDA